MNKNLFISLYPEKDIQRLNELKTCLEKNILVFDIIYVLLENADEFPMDYFSTNEKVTYLPITVRPTFRSFFNAVNNLTGRGDINVVANADVYFEELVKFPSETQVYALTRYEVKRNGPITFLNRSDSQDAWIFNFRIKIPQYADFVLGRPGADNRIAMELSRVGYQVLNPSLTIKIFHLHESKKSYTSETRKVGTPYLRLQPISI